MQAITASLRTDVGRVREHNEDFVGSWEPQSAAEAEANGWLYIVADGVGGAEAGEIASQHATEQVIRFYIEKETGSTAERLESAVRAANRDLRQLADQRGAVRAMATTMVAAVIEGTAVTLANVGDSRGYHIDNDTITQITKDQSLVAKLVEEGTITEAEAAVHPQRNVILSSLGPSRDPRVDLFSLTLAPGQLLLLCSDGLTRHVADDEIAAIANANAPDDATTKLIALANDRGGGDNISVAVIGMGDPLQETLRGANVAAAPPQPTTKRWKLWTYTLFLSMVEVVLITLVYYWLRV